MHEKNITSDIRRTYLNDGLAIFLCLVLYLILDAFAAEYALAAVLFKDLVIIAVYAGIKLYLANDAVKRARDRIGYLNRFGINLNEENFVRVTDEILCGYEWLIWTEAGEYRLWHRNILSYVKEAERDHPGASKGILELYCTDHPGTDAFIFTKAGDVPGILNQWLKGTRG